MAELLHLVDCAAIVEKPRSERYLCQLIEAAEAAICCEYYDRETRRLRALIAEIRGWLGDPDPPQAA